MSKFENFLIFESNEDDEKKIDKLLGLDKFKDKLKYEERVQKTVYMLKQLKNSSDFDKITEKGIEEIAYLLENMKQLQNDLTDKKFIRNQFLFLKPLFDKVIKEKFGGKKPINYISFLVSDEFSRSSITASEKAEYKKMIEFDPEDKKAELLRLEQLKKIIMNSSINKKSARDIIKEYQRNGLEGVKKRLDKLGDWFDEKERTLIEKEIAKKREKEEKNADLNKLTDAQRKALGL